MAEQPHLTEEISFEHGISLQEKKDRAKLYGKMAKIMSELDDMGKEGKHGQGWKYSTADQVANAIRGLMGEHKIAFFVEMQNVRKDAIDDSRTMVDYEFTFACADTGATITKHWSQDMGRRSDQSLGAAHSYAVKYFLMKTFVMSAIDDPDLDKDGKPFFSVKRNISTWVKQMEDQHGLSGDALLEILNKAQMKRTGLLQFGSPLTEDEANEIVEAHIASQEPPADPKATTTPVQPENDKAETSDDSADDDSASKK